VIGGLYERASIRLLLRTQLSLALCVSLVAPLIALHVDARLLFLGLPLGFALLARGQCALCRDRVLLRESLLFCGSAMLWSFAVLVARLQIAAPVAWTHYATLIAALAALLIVVDHRLRVRADLPPRLSPLGLSLHGALLVALALSIAASRTWATSLSGRG